jgi:hypothetical protein
MLTNLLKDLGEIGVAIGGDGDVKVYSFLDVCCLYVQLGIMGIMSPLTLSDPMSDLVGHYDFPVPNAFLDI